MILKKKNLTALEKGLPNLERHIENIRKFGLEVLVAINHFVSDTDKEIQLIKEYCTKLKVKVNLCKHWAEGGSGARGLAENVVEICKNSNKEKFKYLYPDNISVIEKIEKIAKDIYRAKSVEFSSEIKDQIKIIEKAGYGKFPICIAKTQYSFSIDPKIKGAPSNHVLQIREIRLSSGAEFLVVVCGSIMTMPGLPKTPAADVIRINEKGDIDGLF